MKTIKILFAFIIFLLFTPSIINAQVDERQRAKSTIIADVLDQLPAQDIGTLNSLMAEICKTEVDGVMNLISLMAPPEQGGNAKIEYALDGLSRFVTTPEGAEYKDIFREAMILSLDKCKNINNKAFLISLFGNFGETKEASILVDYLNNDTLVDVAIGAIITIPETETFISKCVRENYGNRAALAYAVGCKKFFKVENNIVAWLEGADLKTTAAIYFALSQMGTASSLPILADAAKSVDYGFEETDATACYITLTKKLAAEKDTVLVEKEAKKMLKVKKSNIKVAGMDILVTLYGENAKPYLLKMAKNKDNQLRNEALRMLSPYADSTVYATVIAKAKKDAAKIDVVNWLGNQGATEFSAFVVKQLKSKNSDLVCASISAIGKMEDDKALEEFVPLMGGDYDDLIVETLLAYNPTKGNKATIFGVVTKAINGTEPQQLVALRVMNQKTIPALADRVFALLESPNKEVKDAAYKALLGISMPKHISRFAEMLVSVDDQYVGDVQNAYKKTIAIYDLKRQADDVLSMMKTKPAAKHGRFYMILAQPATQEAIAEIVKGYNGNFRKEALEALLTIDNQEVLETLFEIAKKDAENRDVVLKRYAKLLKKSAESDFVKYSSYKQALELNPSVEVKNIILENLGSTQVYQSLILASEYLNNAETAQAAANTILNVAYNHPEFNGNEIVELLTRIKDIFNDEDATYKKSQIEEHLAKIAKTEARVLSPEEAADGFVLLFDGTNLDKWVGDKTNYIVRDGNIYVTANYGDEGNLYTEKEYGDFVYRFEFCFMRSGVNNGVGIRTPMHADAAYEGMEIQILDHDAPIYKGLREYQVHGSVYGIIPAKRLVFPELGTWNTEEIIAKGDHIKVTVNGEVIVDGDIRKACKGHNMAPEGEETNKYTVDHNSHPGLFNKKGYISFCGHGEGLLIRNVRVKEL